MDAATFDPVARHLIAAYADTAAYSAVFAEEHAGHAPTTLAKAHHLRSVLQALVIEDDRYELGPEYAEFGRVKIIDVGSSSAYVLRSQGAVAAEGVKSAETLFAETFISRERLDDLLLVYAFTRAGLVLSVAGAVRIGRHRLALSGEPTYLGTWAYDFNDGNDDPFEQGATDAFRDLGDLDINETRL